MQQIPSHPPLRDSFSGPRSSDDWDSDDQELMHLALFENDVVDLTPRFNTSLAAASFSRPTFAAGGNG